MPELMDLDEALSRPHIDGFAVLLDHLEAGTDRQEIIAAMRREKKRRDDFLRGPQNKGRMRCE